MKNKYLVFISIFFGFLTSLVLFFGISFLIPKKELLKENGIKSSNIFYAKLIKTGEKAEILKEKKEVADFNDFFIKNEEPEVLKEDLPDFTIDRETAKNDQDELLDVYEKVSFEEVKEKILDKESTEAAFDYEKVDEKPFIIKSVRPLFPFRAKRRGIKRAGIVLKFVVNKKGMPVKIEVVSATHPNIFDESAVKALKQWRFSAGAINGKKVETIMFLPVKYELKN